MSDVPLKVERLERDPTLVDRVVQSLTEAIVSGQLTSGQRLPSERNLGEQLGVSRTVVREAVRTLAARGLVTVTAGRGVEVASIDASTVADSLRLFIRGNQAFGYPQIHEVRSTIEVQTAALAAERATPEDVERLEQLCRDLEQQLTAGNHLAASALDFEFHRALTAATGNDLFLIMLDSIGDILREVRDKAYPTPGVGETGLQAHREIARWVANGDPAHARRAMIEHLAQAEAIWCDDQAVAQTGRSYSSRPEEWNS